MTTGSQVEKGSRISRIDVLPGCEETGPICMSNLVLILLYAAFVAIIWRAERAPPALGEVGELAEAQAAATKKSRNRIGRDLLLVVAGVIAMAAGATLLVEAVQRISGVQAIQTRLGLTIIGFATGFELVVLA